MIKYILIILITLTSSIVLSQNRTKGEIINFQQVTLKKDTSYWHTYIQNMEMPNPDGNSEKARLLKLKNKLSLKYPRNYINKFNHKSSSTDTIKIERGFKGNSYNGRVPNDNTLAISNDGIIVSGINSRYLFYDTNNDSILNEGFFNDFTGSFPQYNTVSKYDPKFIYDRNEDRFIITFLIGTIYQNSNICVAFSSSNNPLDPWNVYILSGNPLGTNHWTDYPAIALNEDELFITGNLLQNNMPWQTAFQQSLIWQIDKFDGFDGNDSLDFDIWSNIIDDTINIRNIHPVRGARELQKTKQYFLSNKNFSAESDTIYMIEIDNTLNSGSANLHLHRLSLNDHYFLSPNGQQTNGKELSTNDSRVLGAIIDESWIQYVHHSMDTSSGTSAIYHGLITNYNSPSPTIEGEIISDSIIDFGYPNIASTAINIDEKECVIGFNYTSSIDTNGIACIYMNNDNIYTSKQIVKEGKAPIDVLSGNLDRWGDYFGIQRVYNNPCKVWMSGMYGEINENGSWISKVSVSDTCRTPEPPIIFEPPFVDPDTTFVDGNISYNFSNDMDFIYFDFIINETQVLVVELFDIKGSLIKELYNDKVNSGENRISINSYYMNSGMYFIRIRNNNDVLFTEKIIKI